MKTIKKINPKHVLLTTIVLIPSLTIISYSNINKDDREKFYQNTTASNLSNCKEIMQLEKITMPKIDLHTAVLKNDIETVKEHIATKSDLNIKESFGGSTPLISASLFGRTEIAKLLINAGANLDIQNNDGSTALITSAFFCQPEIVKMLLAKKANKTIKNNYGQTAYEALLAPFDKVKPVYEAFANALAPMGLKLDYAYIEKTRPVIAKMLK